VGCIVNATAIVGEACYRLIVRASGFAQLV
jgi:hypothetical protein